MICQFIHLEVYSWRKPRRKRSSNNTVESVLGEAWRFPEFSPHIAHPKINQIYGEDFEDLRRRLIVTLVLGKDWCGRPLRRDASILVAGVVSYPTMREEIERQFAEQAQYESWRNLTLDWLRKAHGTALRSVIEHLDEDYPHLHFFISPDPEPAGFLTLDQPTIHPGRFLRRVGLMGNDHQKRTRRHLYKEGMRAYQKSYFEEVSQHFGHERQLPFWNKRYSKWAVKRGYHALWRWRRMEQWQNREETNGPER